jgi:hypothetical protein
MASLVHPERF